METGSNIAASAKSGLEKAKATLEETGVKVTSHSEVEKEMAKEKKQERMEKAEFEKKAAMMESAAAKQAQYINSTAGTDN